MCSRRGLRQKSRLQQAPQRKKVRMAIRNSVKLTSTTSPTPFQSTSRCAIWTGSEKLPPPPPMDAEAEASRSAVMAGGIGGPTSPPPPTPPEGETIGVGCGCRSPSRVGIWSPAALSPHGRLATGLFPAAEAAAAEEEGAAVGVTGLGGSGPASGRAVVATAIAADDPLPWSAAFRTWRRCARSPGPRSEEEAEADEEADEEAEGEAEVEAAEAAEAAAEAEAEAAEAGAGFPFAPPKGQRSSEDAPLEPDPDEEAVEDAVEEAEEALFNEEPMRFFRAVFTSSSASFSFLAAAGARKAPAFAEGCTEHSKSTHSARHLISQWV